MEEFLPGQHYRHVRFGDVVMIVGLATEEMTLRKLVVYTDRGNIGHGIWASPLEIFIHRYELIEEGKELRPSSSFQELKSLIDSEKTLTENEEMLSWMQYMNEQMSLKVLQLTRLTREKTRLKRRIFYLEQKIEELKK